MNPTSAPSPHELSEQDLVKGVLDYSLGTEQKHFVNEQYQAAVSRAALHFHNLVKDTYHHERHRVTQDFLETAQATHIIDVGYGVPGAYLTGYLQTHPQAQAQLLDQDPSAEHFAHTLLHIEHPEILPQVAFEVYDMNTQIHPGEADTYIYLDSIEHTLQPTLYLHKLVQGAPAGSHFIFSIPICGMKGLEGFHFAQWRSNQEALAWVETAGLEVVQGKAVYPNPLVDFFAEFAEGGYHNYLLLCKKHG